MALLLRQAGYNGKWRLELPAMAYGGPYEMKVCGDDTLTLQNVMVGEVWLCGGQSNMRMTERGKKGKMVIMKGWPVSW